MWDIPERDNSMGIVIITSMEIHGPSLLWVLSVCLILHLIKETVGKPKRNKQKHKSEKADPVMFLMLRDWTDKGYSTWIGCKTLSQVFWRKKIGAGSSFWHYNKKLSGRRFKMMTWRHFFHTGIHTYQNMLKADRPVRGQTHPSSRNQQLAVLQDPLNPTGLSRYGCFTVLMVKNQDPLVGVQG